MKKYVVFISVGCICVLSALSGVGLFTWHQSQTQKNKLPDVALYDIDGNIYQLDNKVGKPLFINVWATWCAPCVEEIPELVEFRKNTDPKQLSMISIGIDKPNLLIDFTTRFEINYPVLMGLPINDLLPRMGNQRGVLPYSLLVDAKGKIVKRYYGIVDINSLQADINDLKKQ